MTGTDIAKPDLVYNGEIIHAKAEKLSLTDMWRAAGSPANREPFNWARKEGATFIEAVAVAHNLTDGQVMVTKKGKGGSTLAHWQIALAYAKYLDHAFHMWCNTVVRERMEERAVATAHTLTRYDMQMIGNAINNCAGKVVRDQLQQLLPALVEPMVAARLAEQSFLIRRGKTAGQIWREHGFPRIRVTSWFSNRLVKMECQIDGGGRGELGCGTAKLFDPDKADTWLRNGGRALVNEYVSQRQGQKVLRLVPKVTPPGENLGERAPA